MSKLLRIPVVVFSIFLIFISQSSAAPFVPPAPKISAKAWAAIDYNTGTIIAESNANTRLGPASLTKLMTAYVVFNEIKAGNIALSDQAMVSRNAWQKGQPTGGSHMFAKQGSKISVKELLKGMIIVSGNEASVALAEFIAGDETTFASVMNNYAQKLGMTNTNFTNSTGWPDPDQYTSALDIARLTQAMIHDFPEYYKWYSEKKYKYSGYQDDPRYREIKPQSNRNLLLWRNESVDGVKTGHTEADGYHLVASASQDNMRIITAVFGAKGKVARAVESQKLLKYGYRFFETRKLFNAGEKLIETKIWKGKSDILPLGLTEDIYITLPKRQFKKLDVEHILEPTITAPVLKNNTYGTLSISVENNKLAEHPLVALQDINEGSLWKKMYDTVMLMMQ